MDANLQVLCNGPAGCHEMKTIAEKPGDIAIAFFPEWLEPAICHLTIVFGPPGSGKSRYVEERAGKHDTVIDLDLIASKLSGKPIYHSGIEWLTRSVFARNKQLSALSRSVVKSWFVVSGKGQQERDWWCAKLKPADAVVLPVAADLCIKRIDADERRPEEVKAKHRAAVREWWRAETSPHARPMAKRPTFDTSGRVEW
jgi:hypothetical protein